LSLASFAFEDTKIIIKVCAFRTSWTGF
jgi:hypothetical protein